MRHRSRGCEGILRQKKIGKRLAWGYWKPMPKVTAGAPVLLVSDIVASAK
jgi:hypothetical protein